MTDGQFKSFKCRCYFTDNIFIKKYNVHVRYLNDKQFFRDYGAILSQKGCNDENKRQEVLREIQAEVDRRESSGLDSKRRKETILSSYQPPSKDIFTLKESYLAPDFLSLVSYCKERTATREGVLQRLQTELGDRIYSFPVFTSKFCEEFICLIMDFERSTCPKGRPNTMNNYGVLLDELGLDDNFLNTLRQNYLQPITRLLYLECGGGDLDSHKAFVVQYDLSRDKSLSYHFDNAEVTINVCLGKTFVGGNLYFGSMRDVCIQDTEVTECAHVLGKGILHRGQHRHGAQHIISGERYNLIMWMRSSFFRNQLCPMCDSIPDIVETEGPGDGFTQQNTVSVCELT